MTTTLYTWHNAVFTVAREREPYITHRIFNKPADDVLGLVGHIVCLVQDYHFEIRYLARVYWIDTHICFAEILDQILDLDPPVI